MNTIRRLEEALDVPTGYFSGIHNCRTHEEWNAYQQQKKASKKQEDAKRQKKRRDEELNILLKFFGFTHRVLDDDVHELAQNGESTCFNDEEFQKIIDDIGDRLAFECFKKNRP